MAWNEPGGEKRNPWNRPQQSQNDLDDVLRNIQRKLAALFGRNSGGGPNSSNLGKGVGSIIVLIAVAWVGSGVYRVDAQERAVILRFGKYVETSGPGYNWHLPWPIETSNIVNVSQVYSIADDASMLTADTNLVEVRSAVQYTQPDPIKFLFRVRNVEETLNQVCESAMREAVGQSSLDKALAFDPSITDRALVLMQHTLESYGLDIHIVGMDLVQTLKSMHRGIKVRLLTAVVVGGINDMLAKRHVIVRNRGNRRRCGRGGLRHCRTWNTQEGESDGKYLRSFHVASGTNCCKLNARRLP